MMMVQPTNATSNTVARSPTVLSLKELLATEYPVAKWAVDGLIECGAVTMVSALWGQRKSWLCLHAAVCIASGQPLFGQFPTERQGVLIVNDEDTERMIKERMVILSPPSHDLPIHFLVGHGFRLSNKGVEWLLKETVANSVGVVVFDSLRAIHGVDENDSAAMQSVMDRLKRLAHAGLTVVFTHHNRKPAVGKLSGDANGEETRGSGAINAAVHCHLAVEATKGEDEAEYVIVHQRKNKSAEKVESFRVRVEKSPEGHLAFVYAGGFKPDNSSVKTAGGVITALRASGKWMSIKDLLACGFAKERAIRMALSELKRAGHVAVTNRKETPGIGGAGSTSEEFYTVAIPTAEQQ